MGNMVPEKGALEEIVFGNHDFSELFFSNFGGVHRNLFTEKNIIQGIYNAMLLCYTCAYVDSSCIKQQYQNWHFS